MSAVVYDAGVLVAADRNERRAWAGHKVRLELGVVPLGEREAYEVGRLPGVI